MIIFYNKKIGNIVGTIDGRVHNEDHLKVWIGTKEENDRIIVQWEPINKRIVITEKVIDDGGETDKEGYWQPKFKKVKQKVQITDSAPNHPQKDIFELLDKKPSEIHNYKVNLQTKELTIIS